MPSSQAICKMIAHKMQNPLHVSEFLLEAIPQHTLLKNSVELTLADGLPGITCFYTMMDASFTQEGWHHITDAYVQLIINKLQAAPPLNCSLFEGLSGICFALYLALKQGSGSARLLQELDLLLIRKIEQDFIQVGNQYLIHPSTVPLSFYNLSEGIAGILAYLTLRQDHILFQNIIGDLLSILEQLIPYTLSSVTHSSSAPHLNKNATLHSSLFSIKYGLPGLLASLSLTKGSRHSPLHNVLKTLANWIQKHHHLSPLGGIQWLHPHFFSPQQNLASIRKGTTDNWCYGAPGISRSLYLSAHTIQDAQLEAFSKDAFCSLFLRNKQDWNLKGPAFSIGYAGLLTLVYAMAQHTHNSFLWNKAEELEHDLKGFYAPQHLFGIQSLKITSDHGCSWIDNPGLLEGAAGVGLSLLLKSFPNQKIWQRLFLIN